MLHATIAAVRQLVEWELRLKLSPARTSVLVQYGVRKSHNRRHGCVRTGSDQVAVEGDFTCRPHSQIDDERARVLETSLSAH